MSIHYGVILIMTILGSVASLFLKKASGASDFLSFIGNKDLYIGGALYFVTSILNIWVLQFLAYSVVLLNSINLCLDIISFK